MREDVDLTRTFAIPSNSTWITDDRPCITYGLRGVVHCNVEVKCYAPQVNDRGLILGQITSQLPDLHSGVEGGGVVEPMVDM